MKKIVYFCALLAFIAVSCDKVKNAYPPNSYQGGLDPALYPGDINDYITPTFSPNTNTERNVLIEDFTGHTCSFCPAAAIVAHDIIDANQGRVYLSTVHSGPQGANPSSGFQATNVAPYTYSFINDVSSEIGLFFGNLPGNAFSFNPSGNVSRIKGASTTISTAADEWEDKANLIITANDLKVNIQSEVNYFPTTKGAFIHVEVDQLQTVTNELRMVVAFYEDSIVKPQSMFGGSTNYNYVHHDVLKAHVNGGMNGQIIDEKSLNADGKNYFEMSYKIPDQYAADNCHFLIYVFDKVTHEIYQVIKKEIL